MAKAEEIRKRLWLAAEYTAARHGYKFVPNCREYLVSFISDGVDRMVAENCTDDEFCLALAEANVKAFTMQMIVIARIVPRPGFDARLHTETFFDAKHLISLFWPFSLES